MGDPITDLASNCRQYYMMDAGKLLDDCSVGDKNVSDILFLCFRSQEGIGSHFMFIPTVCQAYCTSRHFHALYLPHLHFLVFHKFY